jgi:hypothetical protein
MERLEPHVSQFGSAFAWLLEKGVSSARLATLFNTTPGNVRVAALRSRRGIPETPATLTPMGTTLATRLAIDLGVRTDPDEVVRTPARAHNLEILRNEIQECANEFSERYEFLGGARELRRLLPRIGFAGDARRIALRAWLHQKIAWFLVHSGRSGSAAEQSGIARDLWRVAHQERGSSGYIKGFVQAALIGSHALLLARRPHEAWDVLDLARDAADSIGDPLGSDHFRQRGVALLQLREDERARKHFEKSAELMEKLNEATVPAQILMTGARHAGLLALDCDLGRDVLASVHQAFGEHSLEASMAVHWAAAASLSTDSPSAVQDAADLLNQHAEPAPQFGHQATIRKLLSITPELGFDARLRRLWVRRALYENAFRSR